MSEEEQKSNFKFLGRDLLKIPCFRNTFLYSISSYLGVGLVTFLFTSRPAFSSHVGFASFAVVTVGYFTKCRMFSESQRVRGQIEESVQRALAMEGSNEEEIRKNLPVLEEV